MFGFLALGIFASLAFANAEGGGKSGGFLSGLLGGKSVSDFMKEKMTDKESKEKEKKEAIEKKEQEVKDLCKKDKKDLTPRDIKRMKELQKEVDVEEFLTNKELKSFADATGYTPKRDVSNIDADDDLTPDEKGEELHKILKKKAGELTPKDKARLKKLASDPDLDREDFSEDELKKFSDATGENLSDKPKEDPKNEDPKQQEAEDLENEQNKALAIAKAQYEEALKDPEKNKDFIEAYETFKTCAYDEDGKLRSPEEFEAEFKKLPKEKQEALSKSIKEAANSKEAQEAYNEKSSNISNEQAKEAAQEVGKDRKNESSAKRNTEEMKKYADFKFEDGLEPADLDSEDPDKKKRAQEQLENAGLDPAVYKAVQKAKADKTVDGKEPSIEDIAADDDVQNTIKDYNKRKKEGDKGGKKEGDDNTNKDDKKNDGEGDNKEGGKGGEPEPGKEGDKGGKKEGDDKDTNDDETEEETKNSEFDDGEPDDEADDEDGKAKQDPRKVWKQKSYKRGDKTFKTKSYYNKKGASITADEFKEKVQNFEKNKDSKPEPSGNDNKPKGEEPKKGAGKTGADYKMNQQRNKQEKKAWDDVAKSDNKLEDLKNQKMELQDQYADEEDPEKKKKLKEKLDKVSDQWKTENGKNEELRNAAIKVSKDLDNPKEAFIEFLQDRLVLERFYPEDITQSTQFKGLDLSAFIKSRIEVED